MLKRIKGQVWFCCPCCEQKLLKVVDWDASGQGLEGICKKCKCEYEVFVSRDEMGAVMTEEERIKEDKKQQIAMHANGLSIDQMDWILSMEKNCHVRNLERVMQTDGKRQAD